MKMLSSVTNIFFLAGILSLTACENNQTSDSHDGNNHDSAQTEKKVLEDDAPNDVIDVYDNLKNALVKDDAENAKKAVEEMRAQLGQVKAENLINGDTTAWKKEAAKLQEHLDKMAAAKDIEEMRTHFSPLSDALYANIKKFGLTDETVYLQHCPMAFNNEGANWLSEEEEISNPYLPKTMLRCGEVKETIEAKK